MNVTCKRCGYDWTPKTEEPRQCPQCKSPRWNVTPTVSQAHGVVANAIQRGYLPKLDGSIACIDCGEPARDYDHRDYNHPLLVDPVCRSCNLRRGKGEHRTTPRRTIYCLLSDDEWKEIKKLAITLNIDVEVLATNALRIWLNDSKELER